MAKRFTESDKWRDAWFATLSNADKLCWLYLCDACDYAGVFDIVPQNDAAALGERIDWDAFILQSEGRVVRLSANKLWLVRFIDFQYPRGLKSSCKAHGPIIRSIVKHGLSVAYDGDVLDKSRVKNPDSSQRVQDKDKDKETDKDKDKERLSGCPPSLVPVVSEWLAYKAERNESPTETSLKQLQGRVRNVAGEYGMAAVEAAMRRAMANGWKGWDHGIEKGASSRPTQSQTATERFLASERDGKQNGSGGGGQLALRGSGSAGP